MICYQKERVLITSAHGEWEVGLSPQADGLVEAWFSKLLLGFIDPKTARVKTKV